MTAALRHAATLVVTNIGQLVTADPRLPAPGVIEDAVLAADSDRIVYAGPASGFDVPTEPDTVEVDARGRGGDPGLRRRPHPPRLAGREIG